MTGLPPSGPPLQNTGPPPVEWYIGREGKQYGPVTDIEFRKLIELGHLKPTDLVWRDGFAEWRPANVLTDAPIAPRPPVAQVPQHRPVAPPAAHENGHSRAIDHPSHSRGGAPSPQGRSGHDARPAPRPQPHVAEADDDQDDEQQAESRVGRRLKIAAVVTFFSICLAAAGWLMLPYKDKLVRSVAVAIPQVASRSSAPSDAGEFRPLSGFTTDRAQNDALLQSSALFQLLKRAHADWYNQRLDELGKSVDGGNDSKAVEGLVQALAQLRRQHAGDVLSAPAQHLTAIASSFVTNLGLLRGVSIDACYKFISNGESAQGIMQLFQSKDVSPALQKQMHAVFAAAEQGRSTPRVYPMPRQTDYTALLAELEARGWTQADMQLFSDSRALAKAAPQDVCRLVTEWFESQLALKDSDIQLRLIADSLKPLIAG